MRARCGSSAARPAGRPGASTIDILFYEEEGQKTLTREGGAVTGAYPESLAGAVHRASGDNFSGGMGSPSIVLQPGGGSSPTHGETPSQWRKVAFQRGSSIPGTPSSRKGAAAYHRSGKPLSAPAAALKQPAHEPGMHPRPAHPPLPPEFTLTSSDQKNVQELGNPNSTTPARPRVHPGNPFPSSKSTLNQNIDIIFIINND